MHHQPRRAASWRPLDPFRLDAQLASRRKSGCGVLQESGGHRAPALRTVRRLHDSRLTCQTPSSSGDGLMLESDFKSARLAPCRALSCRARHARDGSQQIHRARSRNSVSSRCETCIVRRFPTDTTFPSGCTIFAIGTANIPRIQALSFVFQNRPRLCQPLTI